MTHRPSVCDQLNESQNGDVRSRVPYDYLIVHSCTLAVLRLPISFVRRSGKRTSCPEPQRKSRCSWRNQRILGLFQNVLWLCHDINLPNPMVQAGPVNGLTVEEIER
eukprot:scaffold205584_cov39-Prasinocladus_malaysianus.AAC.1